MKDLRGKKITILGAHRSGLAAAKLAQKVGAIPFVSDMGSFDKSEGNFKYLLSLGVPFEHGGHSEKVFDCDFIVTSPGVPSNSTVLMKANFLKIKVISEIEFSSWFCKGDIIAITGTNGKTTTTSLCTHLLKECGLNVKAAGNIGTAFAGMVNTVKQNELVALEVSSFQLDYIEEFKPAFSIILNITPDHLDRYENKFESYKNSKLNIFKNQDEEDFLILNADDENLNFNTDKLKSNIYYFSTRKPVKNGAFYSDGKFFFVEKGLVETICDINSFSLAGEHNISNALSVLTVAKILEIPNVRIAEALKTFKGVEHRLEFVRSFAGAKYINDSKATNVESVWYALQSYEDPIILILGGVDKGNDYARIEDLVRDRVKKIYAIGSSSKVIYDYFHGIVPVDITYKIEDAIANARVEAVVNDVVLLSPACASFDQFDSYEHRGKYFKELVNGLS